MLKTIFVLFTLFLITSCSLNSEQEMALNKSLTKFVDARNNGDALMYANMTHPAILKSYQAEGVEQLKERFKTQKLNLREEFVSNRGSIDLEYIDSSVIWTSPYQKMIKIQDQGIQVKYALGLLQNGIKLDSTLIIYALSADNGKTWGYAEMQDYFSDRFPEQKRLFKK